MRIDPAVARLLSVTRAVGRTGRVYDDLASRSTPNNLAKLAALMQEHQAARTLEIGFAFGSSALVLSDAHASLAMSANATSPSIPTP